jgi:hypothetical protein
VIALVAALVLAQKSSWTQTLSNGTTVTLKAISDDRQQTSWSPEGKLYSKWIGQEIVRSSKRWPNPRNILTVVTFIDNVKFPAFPSMVMFEGTRKLSEYSGVGVMDVWKTRRPFVGVAASSFPRTQKSLDVKVGCASGPWRVLGTYKARTKKADGLDFAREISFIKKQKPNQVDQIEVKIAVPNPLSDGMSAYQLVAFDTDGKVLQSAGSMTKKGGMRPDDFWFSPNRAPLGRIELQARKYEWITFNGLPLHPNSN